MTTEPTSLDDKITELINTLQGQRLIVGDRAVKFILKTALKMSRMKAKDKKEHDKIISENEPLQEFCKAIGLDI